MDSVMPVWGDQIAGSHGKKTAATCTEGMKKLRCKLKIKARGLAREGAPLLSLSRYFPLAVFFLAFMIRTQRNSSRHSPLSETLGTGWSTFFNEGSRKEL